MPASRLVRLGIVLACVAGLVWLLRGLDLRRVAAAASGAAPTWLALSGLAVAGRFLIWAVKWRAMLARRAPVAYGFCLRLLLAGSFVNLTTPTAKLAGGVLRAVHLRRRLGWPGLTAYGWSAADQITNVVGHLLLYGLLAPAAAAVLPPGHLRTTLALTGGAVLVGIAASVLLRPLAWSWVRRPGLARRLSRLVPPRFRGSEDGRDLAGQLERLLGPLLGVGPAWRTYLVDILGAAIAFASICVANALVLRALGHPVPLLIVSVVVVGGYFAGVAVGAWGGIGVTEAVLTALYAQFGVPLEVAAAGALLHRAVFYLIVLGWGGASLWSLSARGKIEPGS